VLVGIWKNQYSALSADNGISWTPIAKSTTLWTTGAKTWGQKSEDNRYAIVHNQSATKRNRFPMAVLVGDDGHEFDRLYCLRGEIPPRRYHGLHKNPGVQYFRGISEGNGDPRVMKCGTLTAIRRISGCHARMYNHRLCVGRSEHGFSSVITVGDLKLWNICRASRRR
jgi:hypothetical protein